jgi:hypothetical protein
MRRQRFRRRANEGFSVSEISAGGSVCALTSAVLPDVSKLVAVASSALVRVFHAPSPSDPYVLCCEIQHRSDISSLFLSIEADDRCLLYMGTADGSIASVDAVHGGAMSMHEWPPMAGSCSYVWLPGGFTIRWTETTLELWSFASNFKADTFALENERALCASKLEGSGDAAFVVASSTGEYLIFSVVDAKISFSKRWAACHVDSTISSLASFDHCVVSGGSDGSVVVISNGEAVQRFGSDSPSGLVALCPETLITTTSGACRIWKRRRAFHPADDARLLAELRLQQEATCLELGRDEVLIGTSSGDLLFLPRL